MEVVQGEDLEPGFLQGGPAWRLRGPFYWTRSDASHRSRLGQSVGRESSHDAGLNAEKKQENAASGDPAGSPKGTHGATAFPRSSAAQSKSERRLHLQGMAVPESGLPAGGDRSRAEGREEKQSSPAPALLLLFAGVVSPSTSPRRLLGRFGDFSLALFLLHEAKRSR